MIIERWKSNKRNREDHYFKDKTYIGGFNPKVLTKEEIKIIRKIFKSKKL